MPVDLVDDMAELYGCPELRTNYCKKECPLGRDLDLATEVAPIEQRHPGYSSRPIHRKDRTVNSNSLTSQADGVIDGQGGPQNVEIVDYLGKLSKSACTDCP